MARCRFCSGVLKCEESLGKLMTNAEKRDVFFFVNTVSSRACIQSRIQIP